ncbi:MAG: PA2169 family four-helix-bundle protein [Solirubrobacterales bacterium]
MRPEAAIALDELAALAADSCEAYLQAAGWAGPGDLETLLSRLGERRAAMARLFEEEVRTLGHLPRDRDTPSGVAHRLLARLKGSFVSDRPRALVEECERSDTALAHGLITVDQRALPEALAETVRSFHAEVVAALGQLAAVKVRNRGH